MLEMFKRRRAHTHIYIYICKTLTIHSIMATIILLYVYVCVVDIIFYPLTMNEKAEKQTKNMNTLHIFHPKYARERAHTQTKMGSCSMQINSIIGNSNFQDKNINTPFPCCVNTDQMRIIFNAKNSNWKLWKWLEKKAEHSHTHTQLFKRKLTEMENKNVTRIL